MNSHVPSFRVYAGDLLLVGFCRRGSREFARFHGLDWNGFLAEGIDARVLVALNDGLADRLIEKIREVRGI